MEYWKQFLVLLAQSLSKLVQMSLQLTINVLIQKVG